MRVFAVRRGPIMVSPWCGLCVVSTLFVQNPLRAGQKRSDNTGGTGIVVVVARLIGLEE